jgi:hypothetical protein
LRQHQIFSALQQTAKRKEKFSILALHKQTNLYESRDLMRAYLAKTWIILRTLSVAHSKAPPNSRFHKFSVSSWRIWECQYL